MTTADRDPIHAVKAFLARSNSNEAGRVSTSAIAPQLEEIYRRYHKARKIHEGVGLSEALDRLKVGGGNGVIT